MCKTFEIYCFREYQTLIKYLHEKMAEKGFKFDKFRHMDLLAPNEQKEQIGIDVKHFTTMYYFTCHEIVLNYFGHMAANKSIDPKSVKVFYHLGNKLHEASYDNDGFLISWGYGYFDWEKMKE